MKATIKRTIEESFEVKLPCFVRSDYHFYKVTSPENAVQVFIGHHPSIQLTSINVAFSSSSWRYCNAEDFASAFENVMAVIENEAYAPVREEVENDCN